jgi:elongator complex protein 3
MKYYQLGLWKPYTQTELVELLKFCLINTPRYCRLTRIIRDIPSTDIVTGNLHTNLRQTAEMQVHKSNHRLLDIRSREIKNLTVKLSDLKLNQYQYKTSVSQEIFLEYITKDERIAGFLRLSLPSTDNYIQELSGSAIIREVHVYGQALDVGTKSTGKAQHLGLGSKLIKRAQELAVKAGFHNLAVISAIGTKEYYRKLGFQDGNYYQHLACQ